MTSLKLYFSFLYSWHTPKYKLELRQLERILNINKLILNLKIFDQNKRIRINYLKLKNKNVTLYISRKKRERDLN